jgi:hypothetical protein
MENSFAPDFFRGNSKAKKWAWLKNFQPRLFFPERGLSDVAG